MSVGSLRWWRHRYMHLAAFARRNAARCSEPEMRDKFLDVASAWQLMADEINLELEETVPWGETPPSKPG